VIDARSKASATASRPIVGRACTDAHGARDRGLVRGPAPAPLRGHTGPDEDDYHWIVLVSAGRHHVMVVDPALGRRRLTLGWMWPLVRPHAGILLQALGFSSGTAS
jgi:hypothetical protein